MLQRSYTADLVEAGCDEAGRGCLAGPVFAAAVILPPDFSDPGLNDSKKLSEKERNHLRSCIEKFSLTWAVASCDAKEIDEMNILNASIEAMHRAVTLLGHRPQLLLVDGNRFHPINGLNHICVVQGDAQFMSIAAASILAKTHRDEYMYKIHNEFPVYKWDVNKGYPTKAHKIALCQHGSCVYHRQSFKLSKQLRIEF